MKLHEVSIPKRSIWTPRRDGNVTVCSQNLTSLKGAPSEVHGYFICSENPIRSLEGAPNKVGGSVWATHCEIVSLHNIHKIFRYIGNELLVHHNPIESHILGVCLIEGLKHFWFDSLSRGVPGPIDNVMNKYIGGGPDSHEKMFKCQEELIDAGFAPYARV